MIDSVPFYFPLRRPHAGVPLGNGKQGLLIWGDDSLRLTVSRAGFWDHRGGGTIPPETNFALVRAALENGDDAALAQLFPARKPGAPFPQQFGGGRLELTFASGRRPLRATLDLETATAEVVIGFHEDDSAPWRLRVRQAAEEEIIWLEGAAEVLADVRVRLEPAFDLVRENAMAALGIAPPKTWSDADAGMGGGFLQMLPEDAPLAVAWRFDAELLLLTTALGENAESEARKNLAGFDPARLENERADFWREYWAASPTLRLPDKTLQRQFEFGLYRQAGLIRKNAPAATLQGPWMEDTTIPPWSNDYHFNINVQLVYGAALATGRAADMEPLWTMLRAWIPRFRELGENFYGIPGAMLLPHAVDDRCQMMGAFWAGAIDQACIAWMGRMAWQFYQHTDDTELLREIAWPLLRGAFLGYWAMAERTENSSGSPVFSLPVSVSPEYGGSDRTRCWGRNASFQLAAWRATAETLQNIAPILGEEADPRWAEVAAHLPAYTLVPADDGAYGWIGSPAMRIALWENQDLAESHRHHSHLAAIYPFCTLDPFAPEHQKNVARSIHHWNRQGAGNWTGWCLPWASILCSRCGLADAAAIWLRLLAEGFTNEGHATLHNADHSGVFSWDDGSLQWPDHRKGANYGGYEIMQMDAAMGALSATIELLVSFRDGSIVIADRLPKGWREAEFHRVHLEGGFVVSGIFRHGRAEEVTVESERGGELRLSHSLGENWTLDGAQQCGERLVKQMRPGERCVLRRCSG